MFRYAEVEAALAGIHEVAPEGMGAFKGRIIHFQRIGLGPGKSGRGRKIEYTLEDVLTWAFCLQLAEFGIDPKTIQAIHRWASPAIDPGLYREVDGDDVFFLVTPMVMSHALSGCSEAPVSWELTTYQSPLVFCLNLQGKDIQRAIIINLSRLRTAVVEKLSH